MSAVRDDIERALRDYAVEAGAAGGGATGAAIGQRAVSKHKRAKGKQTVAKFKKLQRLRGRQALLALGGGALGALAGGAARGDKWAEDVIDKATDPDLGKYAAYGTGAVLGYKALKPALRKMNQSLRGKSAKTVEGMVPMESVRYGAASLGATGAGVYLDSQGRKRRKK